jgi:hypothetical protein
MVSFLLVSCKQKGGSGEAYTLKMRLTKGDKFAQDLDMNMKMGMSIMGQNMDMNMDMKSGTAFEVTNAAPDIKELTMTYTKMDMSMEMKGQEGMNKKMGDMDAGKKIVGKKVIMKINDQNKITEIAGVEDAIWGDSTDMATREQMKKMFSKEQLNSMFGMMFQMYPDKPVRIGDTWEKENEVTISGITMKMQGKYKLASVKDGVAYVDIDGKFKGKGKMQQGGMDMEMEMDMDGGQKGNINIGIADGYLKDSQITMDIKADMNMMGQKIPVTMKGYYLVKGK